MNTDILKLLFACCFAVLLSVASIAQTKLVPNKITLKSGKSFSLNLPPGYEIIPAAEGLKRVRFFAKAPDGRIFVTDMRDLTDNKKGIVYILDGWDAKKGKFAKVVPYMTDLKNPNSCQFYKDENGQDWFYLAATHKLTRRKFTLGETKPTDTKPEVLATFPDYGLSYKYGGWHLTRTIAFSPDRKLYVSVGSSCNACIEKERVRGCSFSFKKKLILPLLSNKPVVQKFIRIFLLLAGMQINAGAQRHMYIGLFGGITNYKVDLGSTLLPSKPNGVGGVSMLFELNHRMIIRGEFNYGKLHGSEAERKAPVQEP